MEIKDIIELMKAVSENGLTKFELEQGDTKLVMKREKKIMTVAGVSQTAGGVTAVMNQGDSMLYTGIMSAAQAEHKNGFETAGESGAEAVSGNVITCPLVGTFYASPSPDAENFVKVGDRVKKGQVLGIVEAMKLMNEIESEYDGVVEEILVKNEDTVEYGQPLFRIC